MAGNSFVTHDGTHVPGTVAMVVGEDGLARPVGESADTGTAKAAPPFTLDQLCRALAAHAVLCRGGSVEKEADAALVQIVAFVAANPKE